MNKPTIGIIGFGRQGKQHYSALKQLEQSDQIKIVGICDVIQSKIDNTPFFLDYKDMLKTVKPNVVLITVPNYLHKQITLDALHFGCDVIKEKPLAINYIEGKEIVDTAEKLQKFVITTQQRYYSPLYIEVKKALHYLGTITSFSYVFTLEDVEQSWYWDIKKSGGGSWLNIGWHGISTLTWLLGNVTTIRLSCNVGGKRPWEYRTDHSSLARLTIGKVHGTAFFSCIYPKEEKLIITGEQGTLYMNRGKLYVNCQVGKIDMAIVSHEENIYLSQLESILQFLSSRKYDMRRDLRVLHTIQNGLDSMKGI